VKENYCGVVNTKCRLFLTLYGGCVCGLKYPFNWCIPLGGRFPSTLTCCHAYWSRFPRTLTCLLCLAVTRFEHPHLLLCVSVSLFEHPHLLLCLLVSLSEHSLNIYIQQSMFSASFRISPHSFS
jgi:hypothetical protein